MYYLKTLDRSTKKEQLTDAIEIQIDAFVCFSTQGPSYVYFYFVPPISSALPPRPLKHKNGDKLCMCKKAS